MTMLFLHNLTLPNLVIKISRATIEGSGKKNLKRSLRTRSLQKKCQALKKTKNISSIGL
jgi:hypothetical protein